MQKLKDEGYNGVVIMRILKVDRIPVMFREPIRPTMDHGGDIMVLPGAVITIRDIILPIKLFMLK